MTLEKRREFYWTMYTAAVGIAELMTQKEVYSVPAGRDFSIPYGMCTMTHMLGYQKWDDFNGLYELIQYKPAHVDNLYWFEPGDWAPRAELLLKAIELTYKN